MLAHHFACVKKGWGRIGLSMKKDRIIILVFLFFSMQNLKRKETEKSCSLYLCAGSRVLRSSESLEERRRICAGLAMTLVLLPDVFVFPVF